MKKEHCDCNTDRSDCCMDEHIADQPPRPPCESSSGIPYLAGAVVQLLVGSLLQLLPLLLPLLLLCRLLSLQTSPTYHEYGAA